MSFPPELLRTCWFLAGPTACGKTDAGLELAERIGAEIVALDSMSLYRRMDVGTAKPTAAQQARVPHHLLDVLEPWDECSVAEYVDRAAAVGREIVARGRIPLFVGGTGLYLRSLLRGVFDGPPADWDLRRTLYAAAESQGPESLHVRLREVDPRSAQRLPPQDVRRVVRALEVHALTGRPLSDQHEQGPRPAHERTRHVYWLEPPRAWLADRIARRTAAMFESGLLDEVRRLLAEPHPLSRTASAALGYRETLAALAADPALDARRRSALIEEIATHTRQFAKRQHTWFRNLEECVRIPITGRESATETAELVLRGAGGLRAAPTSTWTG